MLLPLEVSDPPIITMPSHMLLPLIEKLLNVIAEPVLFVSVENSTALVVPTV